jgi:hypothetical protein
LCFFYNTVCPPGNASGIALVFYVSGSGLIQSSVYRNTSFLHKMTDDKKNSDYNEGNIDHQYNAKTLINCEVIAVVIQQKNKRTKTNADQSKNDTANELPLPGDNQQGN